MARPTLSASVITPLLGISAALHAYIAWRLLPDLAQADAATNGIAGPALAWTLGMLLAASTLLIPYGLLAPLRSHARAQKTRSAHDQGSGTDQALVTLGLVAMGLCSSLLVLTFLRDLSLGVLATVDVFHTLPFDLHSWAVHSAVGVPLLALLTTALGYVNARRIAGVKTVTVPIAELPADLEGFAIAQISDIHVGPTIRAPQLQGIVDAVNRLNADMVAITGDLVDGSVHELGEHVRPLAQLRARHGTFFVTGNHDYYSGAPDWIALLQTLQVRVLLNEHAVLQHGAGQVVVAGITDYTAHHFVPEHRSDPHAALHGAPDSAGVRLLLAHQPRSAALAAGAGYHLQLSGHTHGGQFLPWNFFVKLQQPFVAGLHRVHDFWIYTSRGTGYWGPPKRFGAPSEITLLRLIRA